MSVSRFISEQLRWSLAQRPLRAVALPLCLVAALLVSSSARPDAQRSTHDLPGGAQSLNERHEDWEVHCTTPSAGKVHCIFGQDQVRKDDHRRVLSIQLTLGATRSAVAGALVMPFGLRLSKGVDLIVDDKALMSAPFSTCLQAGCVVPLSFDAKQVGAMSSGEQLSIAAVVHDSGKSITFSVSLKGFSSALSRTAELTGVH